MDQTISFLRACYENRELSREEVLVADVSYPAQNCINHKEDIPDITDIDKFELLDDKQIVSVCNGQFDECTLEKNVTSACNQI